jgi:hypothetical protein
MNEAAAKPVHAVPVRELVEFVLRKGDLGGERQFVGSDRAMAGIRGHQKLQRSRPAGYQTEIAPTATSSISAGANSAKRRWAADQAIGHSQ